MAKLRAFADKHKEKLLKFSSDWEKVRGPLIEEYRELKDSFSKREVCLHSEYFTTLISGRNSSQTGASESDACRDERTPT